MLLVSFTSLVVLFYLIINPLRMNLITNSVSQINSDFSKSLGSFSQVLILISFIYVVVYYLYRYRKIIYTYTQKGLERLDRFNQSIFNNVKIDIKNYYKIFRKPLLYLHGVLNFTAVLIGTIHGYQLIGDADGLTLITGVLLYTSMLLLSIAGVIVLFRINYTRKLRWINRKLKIIHKQWFFTIIILVTLIIHTA